MIPLRVKHTHTYNCGHTVTHTLDKDCYEALYCMFDCKVCDPYDGEGD